VSNQPSAIAAAAQRVMALLTGAFGNWFDYRVSF